MNSRKACGKKRKLDKKEAEEWLAIKVARSGLPGRIYLCPNCGWWHVSKNMNINKNGY